MDLWVLTIAEGLLFFHIHFLFVASILSANPVLCFNVTPCFKTHIGSVPRWNNEIRGISFITDFAILFQSPLFTRAAKVRKSRQISRLINQHPAPFFFSYLLSSCTLLSGSSLHIVPHNSLLLALLPFFYHIRNKRL